MRRYDDTTTRPEKAVSFRTFLRSLKTEEEDSFQNKAREAAADLATESVASKRSLRSSAKGRTVDALASQGDEGRGKLRQAWGSGKHTLIPGFPNGAIRRGLRPVTSG